MFLDDTHEWPRDENPRRPTAKPGNRTAARLFLILALATAFLPFSLPVAVDIARYLLG